MTSGGFAVWIRDAKNCSNARAVASRRTAELENLMNIWNCCNRVVKASSSMWRVHSSSGSRSSRWGAAHNWQKTKFLSFSPWQRVHRTRPRTVASHTSEGFAVEHPDGICRNWAARWATNGRTLVNRLSSRPARSFMGGEECNGTELRRSKMRDYLLQELYSKR